jgi:small subunit ribosomal protein S20
MPQTKSMEKALRQSVKRRARNIIRKRTMKLSVKGALAASKAGDEGEKKETLSAAFKAIDKAAHRGVISKNAAARKKSRLVKRTSAS